jgi:hypothetical protein
MGRVESSSFVGDDRELASVGRRPDPSSVLVALFEPIVVNQIAENGETNDRRASAIEGGRPARTEEA